MSYGITLNDSSGVATLTMSDTTTPFLQTISIADINVLPTVSLPIVAPREPKQWGIINSYIAIQNVDFKVYMLPIGTTSGTHGVFSNTASNIYIKDGVYGVGGESGVIIDSTAAIPGTVELYVFKL